MPDFTSRTLALLDDTDDRDRSDDGHSRYGAYLRINADQFHNDGDPLTPAEFAHAAWRIATSPVMSPGYVRIRPDLRDVTPDLTGDDYDSLALRIVVPVRHTALTRRSAQLTDWATRYSGWGDDRWKVLVEPEPTNRAALLLTATLLVPVPEHALIAPTTTRPGRTLTREAKRAVRALAEHANSHAHLVADLLGGGR